MAQGGNIPTNRTQTVTFYNTTGIIEKEKGIYLSPSFKNKLVGAEVRDIYLDVLNSTAIKDADYTDIPISTWSPEDRTLTVRGNIDDFRLVTEEGDCLNYLVITRNVTKLVNNVSTIYKYYYGFFITGVAQAGGSSVKLTLEPDTFTNVFYLHNKHTLTALEVSTTDYEPFNERMKNCHVNRQHYNRVRKETSYLLKINMNTVSADPHLEVGKTLLLDFADHAQTMVQGVIKYFDDRDMYDGILYVELYCEEQQEIGEPDNLSSFTYENNNYSFDYELNDIDWETITQYYPDNLRIFLNQEESFKFKYQYKNKKIPFAISELFTESELSLIDRTDNFNSLLPALKSKILKSCLSYLVLEMKSGEKLQNERSVIYGGQDPEIEQETLESVIMDNGLTRYSVPVFVPTFVIPEIFSKYSSAINAFDIRGQFAEKTQTWSISDSWWVLYYLGRNALADFVFSAYLVNDILIPEENFEFDFTNKYVIIKNIYSRHRSPFGQGYLFSKNLLVVGLSSNQTGVLYENSGLEVTYSSMSDYLQQKPNTASGYRNGLVMLMLNNPMSRKITLDMSEEASDVRYNFYDPVLEAEPYSFYSISYLSYELPLNKNRYYYSNSIDLSIYVSVNGAIKIGIIPSYVVEGNKNPYFNEGLVFTLPSLIPLVSDSYSSYYYQNQAQMKNQFAVNDYNRGTDLLQHFVMSGPNAVGQQAFKRGGYGAIAETINQASQMYNEIIDWGQSNKVIEMNQKAKLADMGAKPDNVKQTGSDVFYDTATSESRLFYNHYTIDKASYDSIAKFLERFGYQINLYDTLHVNDRVGWNYIKLNSFDINPAFDIMVGQEQDLMRIFSNGVTLLHDKTYLTNGHNYERILDE